MPDESLRPSSVVRLRSGGLAMTAVKKVPAVWECTRLHGVAVRAVAFVECDLVTSPGAGPARGEGTGPTLRLEGPRFSL